MEIVFFVDRNLGKQFLIMLRDRGHRAEVHDDHFAQGTTDVEWIPVVAKKQWIAVSMDDRIRYNPVEQAMVFGSGLRLLLLAGKPPLKLHAENVWRSMLAIERFVSRNVRRGSQSCTDRRANRPESDLPEAEGSKCGALRHRSRRQPGSRRGVSRVSRLRLTVARGLRRREGARGRAFRAVTTIRLFVTQGMTNTQSFFAPEMTNFQPLLRQRLTDAE